MLGTYECLEPCNEFIYEVTAIVGQYLRWCSVETEVLEEALFSSFGCSILAVALG